MMLDFIGYGRPGYEFLSYAENAMFPFETPSFCRPSRYYLLYNDDVGVYDVYQEPAADAVAKRENCAEWKSKALDIVDPVTGENYSFPSIDFRRTVCFFSHTSFSPPC
ncbi:uncharacterized protein LOC112685811 [Sipha flava]|uniref:Uncharacterized protein LOC112685811 n=1 Tax=Sipha flava TaxID=143950 RepID=A0A8B8FTC4_9HEMI|nr:uncharacterized protein LOC112685811 [Sipha flava]